MNELRARLERELLVAEPADLAPHAEHERLFLVSEPLDVLTVGEAIVSDDASLVESWLHQGKLRRVGTTDVEAWAGARTPLAALIVRPYVLCQIAELTPAATSSS